MKYIILLSFLAAATHGYENEEAIPDYRTMPTVKEFPIEGKIVNGEVVVPNSLPYQVGIFARRSTGLFFCGASLVSQNYLLTAAHCLTNVTSVRVHLGDHNKNVYEPPNEINMTTTDFAIHEAYNTTTLSNDIAWVKLPTSVNYTTAIQPIPLPSRSDAGIYEAMNSTISGWGRIGDDIPGTTDLLRAAHPTTLEWEACAEYYQPGAVTQAHICTDHRSGSSTCSGDSGGPLVVDGVQIGLVSFGRRGSCVGAPSAFTRLHSFLDWIEENTDAVIGE